MTQTLSFVMPYNGPQDLYTNIGVDVVTSSKFFKHVYVLYQQKKKPTIFHPLKSEYGLPTNTLSSD